MAFQLEQVLGKSNVIDAENVLCGTPQNCFCSASQEAHSAAIAVTAKPPKADPAKESRIQRFCQRIVRIPRLVGRQQEIKA